MYNIHLQGDWGQVLSTDTEPMGGFVIYFMTS